MKNVRVLDCTLRDGGRIIDCAFPDNEIKDISSRLSKAKIDIIEVGFIRDWRKVHWGGNSTFFTDVDQIAPYLDKSRDTMYVAFIDYGLCDIDTLKPCDGKSIDGIRYGFTKKNFLENREDVIRWAKIIKERGYKLFIQGVNSLNYNDKELLGLIDLINEIHPYGFGIVDTYGAMYEEDVDRIYGLVDHNLAEDIAVDFHSHNNYQLSFSFACEVIKQSRGARQIIIDSTLNGMGKVAGNLNTELIVNYLTRKLHYDYELDNILDLIDDYIVKYAMEHKWGYSIPAMMAGIYKSHPNNILYLTSKFRLQSKDIGNLLSMIDPQKRQRYDYDNIERLYIEYAGEKVDDYSSIELLKNQIQNREVLVLVPGNSLNTYKSFLDSYIKEKKPVVISVNFSSGYPESYMFYGNEKRYDLNSAKNKDKNRKVIITSNIHTEDKGNIVVNYDSLINRGYQYFENSTIMLLNLLKKIEVKQISIAGFDGFDRSLKSNYADESFQNVRHLDEFDILNKEISEMLEEYYKTMKEKCEITFITPSRFSVFVQNVSERDSDKKSLAEEWKEAHKE